MMNKIDKILLGHGSGGQMTHELIDSLFMKYFKHPILSEQTDSAILDIHGSFISFTTDSFVVDPIFFPGGNIGKLAVCGTVNDIAVSGAAPLYLSVSFILEEGLPFKDLEEIVAAMAKEADEAGISIVTGDTKVVDRGKCDKIFITTTGIGTLSPKNKGISTGMGVKPGDKVIINGSLGDHGIAILAARQELNLKSNIHSDCASLNHLIRDVMDKTDGIRFMRDPTRGGLATVMTELASGKEFGIRIDEASLVIREEVRNFCEILGFDPIYLANEGKAVLVVEKASADKVLSVMRSHELGKDASVIGEIVADHPGRAWMTTGVGGQRILDMLAGEQLPRIC